MCVRGWLAATGIMAASVIATGAPGQDASTAPSEPVALPTIQVAAPARTPTRPQSSAPAPAAVPAQSPAPAPAAAPTGPLSATSAPTTVPFDLTTTTPFNLPASLDKTGTPIRDVPRSIQIIPRQLFEQQGATTLADTLRNVSGVTQGGQFAFGFYDRFVIRGLNATFLNDGLPDTTSDLTGIPHSLTGVERVEILKGPGSALYGSSQPGGTINLVHARPSDTPAASVTEQIDSFATTTTDISATGPTGTPNIDWRVDGRFQDSEGFRGLHSQVGEILPALSWRPENHDVELRFEYRHLELLPDATGIPFSPPKGTGLPLGVPVDFRYYTPFAKADQDIARVFASDAWTVDDFLVVNNRMSFTNRSVDILRDAGGSVNLIGPAYELTNRQLRAQSDNINDLIYQIEPTWRFQIGEMKQTLVSGFEARRVDAQSSRQTADLPNISNIYAPVVPEQALSSLTFKCDSGHSCYNDDLWARLYGLYLIDQIQVTDALKLRISGRQNWFTTAGEARALLPVNSGNVYPCPSNPTGCPFLPGVPVSRFDAPFSWDAGAVYFLQPHLSVFAGYSNSSYPIFNTEEPQTVGQAPEHGTQYEAGIRYEIPSKLTISTALYQATRENVFILNTVPNPSGPGNVDQTTFFNYRVKGWETDITVRPTERWTIIANLALQNPTITTYPQTPADVGNLVPSVPTVLANLWTTYDLMVSEPVGVLRASFGARYRDREYADAGETRLVPGAPLFDAGLERVKDRYVFKIGINNIFDRQNFLYADGTGGGAFPGPGRMAYVRLSAKW
jgi:iron complex outermembrane recepter protein